MTSSFQDLWRAEVSLYLVASRGLGPPGEFLDRVRAALRAGVHLVQMREKRGDRDELLDLGRSLADLCRAAGRPLVVNDDAELARDLGAAGLHVGQDDISPAAARGIVGPEVLIGLSTHSVEQARRAFADPAVATIGIGPVFVTRTKNAGPALGPALWTACTTLPGAKPAWAIGGIDEDRLPSLVAAGCRRVAVASAILAAPDVDRAVRRLLGILHA